VGILPSRQSARLARHGDVLRLVVRHARPGLIDQAGLEAELQDLDGAGGMVLLGHVLVTDRTDRARRRRRP